MLKVIVRYLLGQIIRLYLLSHINFWLFNFLSFDIRFELNDFSNRIQIFNHQMVLQIIFIQALVPSAVMTEPKAITGLSFFTFVAPTCFGHLHLGYLFLMAFSTLSILISDSLFVWAICYGPLFEPAWLA
jgi:hypothetical protein